MIFQTLLKEALDDSQKPFNTIDELVAAVKAVLSSYGKIAKSDITLPAFSKIGYTYKTHKREIALKVSGEESHALIPEFKKAKIHCRYSSVSDKLIISFADNVKTLGLLSPNTQEEMESGRFHVLGATVDHMSEIEFDQTQTAIYTELNKYKLAKWETITKKMGKTDKIQLVYTLIPQDGEI
jgi:hypothetical protein